MAIKEENAYLITNRLAFPRLVGSEGEKKAIEILLDELKKAGYEHIIREKFKTSFYVWFLARIAFIPLGVMMILIPILFITIPLLSLIFSLITLLILFKLLSISDALEIKLSKKERKNFETENLHVKLEAKNAKATIIFLGHWDSKSQTMPVALRLVVYIISFIGDLILLPLFIILSLIKLIMNFGFPVLNIILLVSSIILAIIGMLNIFNKTKNDSPGAKDNATAVGTVIELARYFRKNPLQNLNLIFLLTGSEELNLGGAKSYITSHRSEFDKEHTYVVNMDSIGGDGAIKILTAYGIPPKPLSKELEKLFIKASENLVIEIKKVYIPTGAWADHAPFTKLGFKATTLASDGGMKEMHTTKDDMSLVSKNGLKDCLLMCVEVAKEIEKKYS